MIDTHAHLDQIEDCERALADADKAGVEAVLAVGVDLASMKKNIEIRKKTLQPKIYLGLGIHPGCIKKEELDETVRFIRDNIHQAKAIGEIGLDFWYKWVRKDQDKKNEQREVFRKMLSIAVESGLPAVIHTRGTWRESFETVREMAVSKALFHWYSGPVDVLKDILDAGYFVSCSPSLAYSPQSREAISNAPVERTLIETDSPVYYHDRNKEGDGFTAGPKDVLRTLKAYAELKRMDEVGVRNILNDNARRFFSLG